MHRPETYRRAFWILLVATTLVRLLLIGRFGLGTDEAHYVLYGRHLAWGYFDHPPMVGFLAALTGALGDGLFFVRLGPLACWVAATILARRLVLALYRDEAAAFWAAVVMLCMPLSHLMAVALLPDATLDVFWCGALLAAWFAARDGKAWQWLLVGILFGGALLSKYHGVLLAMCLFLYLVADRERRRQLLSPAPWIGLAVGIVVFSPNILWNLQNDWISYAYQLGQGGGKSFKVKRLFESLGGQFGGASPILPILLVAAWISLLRTRPRRSADLFVVATSLPVFVFFWLAGLKGKLLPHWAFVGWWTGSIAIVIAARRAIEAGGARARRWRRWSVGGCALGAAIVLVLYAAIVFPLTGPLYEAGRSLTAWLHERVPAIDPLPESPGVDPLYGWEIAAERVEGLRSAMPRPDETFVFSHRFYTVSCLAVYLPESVPVTALSRRADQYRLWFDPSEHLGWDALFVEDVLRPGGPERYRPLFREMEEEPAEIRVMRGGWPARTLHVFRCRGYLGGYEPIR
jgi:4-amino-4-deoxy-L-arabinose transferase-like glycosyltransferase